MEPIEVAGITGVAFGRGRLELTPGFRQRRRVLAGMELAAPLEYGHLAAGSTQPAGGDAPAVARAHPDDVVVLPQVGERAREPMHHVLRFALPRWSTSFSSPSSGMPRRREPLSRLAGAP